MTQAAWPELPYAAWKETYATLHLWTQIVGKIRLAQTPWLNHSWHVVLYVSARGLTTSPIPFGDRSFQLDFDFLDHVLRASVSDGGQKQVGLFPRSVADFYADLMRSLAELGIEVRINELPNEIPDAIRFSEDHAPCFLRSRLRRAALAGPAAGKSGAACVSDIVHRQVQPGSFLLGKFRLGGDALLRPAGAAASGRRAQSSRRRDARGLFA